MSIIRTSKRSHYVAIDQLALADLSLSWEAKGLHAYLLSRPDNWVVNVNQLGKYGLAGRDKIYRMLKELIERGYAERRMARSDSGSVIRHEFIVHESKINPPPSSLPTALSPLPEKPDLAKTTLTNIDNKLILTVASSEQPLAINWEPSDDSFQVLSHHRIDRGFIESLIPEFVVYWRERNQCSSSWNAKFVAQVLRQWRLRSQSAIAVETPKQTLQRFFDRRWAEGLVANETAAEDFLENDNGDD
jgi:hypothetical protein